MKRPQWAYTLSGACAGVVAGLFGAGGGSILIPLLHLTAKPKEEELFPTSVSIMLPICVTVICLEAIRCGSLPWATSIPYLLGSAAGGILAGLFAKKIPTLWLHRGLGVLIIWGGIRYIC